MNKVLAIAFAGFVGMASQAEATVSHEVWSPWRKDMCAEGIKTDVKRCYDSLYCPRGFERVDMTHRVAIRQAKFGEDWREFFTSCSAECVPVHHHGHHHHG